MNESEVSLCQIHGDKLEEIRTDIREIKQYFVGTDEKRGLLARMEIVESFKKTCMKVVWIIAGTFLTVIVTAGTYAIITRL